MIRAARRLTIRSTPFRAPFWAFLIAALFSARALAPEFALSAPQGYVPICQGGEIVWLALDGGEPKTPGDEQPCPIFGLGPALFAAAPALPPRARPHGAPAPTPSPRLAAAEAPLSYLARAPPQAV